MLLYFMYKYKYKYILALEKKKKKKKKKIFPVPAVFECVSLLEKLFEWI